MLELGEDLLDRIKVGAVGRQEQEMRSSGADGAAGRLALVTAEVVEDDDLAFCQGGRLHFPDIGREELTVGPSMTQGALIRSWRSAAMMVIVFHWPKGADASRRCPLGPQPRSGRAGFDRRARIAHAAGGPDDASPGGARRRGP